MKDIISSPQGNFLFVHGGPGLNSKPEETILGKLSRQNSQYHFWHELSSKRNTDFNQKKEENFFNPFLENITSLLNHIQDIKSKTTLPLTLICHSYATQYILTILSQGLYKEIFLRNIDALILIAPAINLQNVDQEIFKLCLQDFEVQNEEFYDKLRNLLNSQEKINDPKLIPFPEESFLLVIQNENLFSHYFQNKEHMEHYFGNLLPPQYDFDFESFTSLRESTTKIQPESIECHLPTLAIYGEFDPIINEEVQARDLKKVFTKIKEKSIPHTGHFPHIEKPKSFHETISNFLTSVSL